MAYSKSIPETGIFILLNLSVSVPFCSRLAFDLNLDYSLGIGWARSNDIVEMISEWSIFLTLRLNYRLNIVINP